MLAVLNFWTENPCICAYFFVIEIAGFVRVKICCWHCDVWDLGPRLMEGWVLELILILLTLPQDISVPIRHCCCDCGSVVFGGVSGRTQVYDVRSKFLLECRKSRRRCIGSKWSFEGVIQVGDVWEMWRLWASWRLFEMAQAAGHGGGGRNLRISPHETPRISNITSSFRNFLGLRKTTSPGSSLHSSSSEPLSSRPSDASFSEVEGACLGALKLNLGTVSLERDPSQNAEAEISICRCFSSSRLHESRRENQNVVTLAFDASVREISHAGIIWAMEHTLKRGDVLTIVSVLSSIRGPFGIPIKVGDQKWLTANQKLVEEEIRCKINMWKEFPGLQYRCEEGGLQLVVIVKAAHRPEVAIVKEAIKQGAAHVVLDKSLKNRRREFYLQNLTCCVTRMRRSGGVQVIRSSSEPHSPTSVIPSPRLSYGDQVAEFENTLGTKRLSLPLVAASLSSSSQRSSIVRHNLSSSFKSTSTVTDHHDIDDDLFSIYHGATRHNELATELLVTNTRPSCYESDELFASGNADTTSTNSNLAITEPLTQVVISRVTFVVGLAQSVEIILRGALRPGEGLLVGSSPSALFLLQGDAMSCHRLSAGTSGSYIAMEGRMAMKLAYLESDQRVLAVDTYGRVWSIPIDHAITTAKPLVLVEAHSEGRRHSLMLHHSDSLCLSAQYGTGEAGAVRISVKSLKIGDNVLLRLRSTEPSHAICLQALTSE